MGLRVEEGRGYVDERALLSPPALLFLLSCFFIHVLTCSIGGDEGGRGGVG